MKPRREPATLPRPSIGTTRRGFACPAASEVVCDWPSIGRASSGGIVAPASSSIVGARSALATGASIVWPAAIPGPRISSGILIASS